MSAQRRREDLTGQRFGALLVLGPAYQPRPCGGQRAIWRLRCDCGVETWAFPYRLRKGMSRCHACQNREQAAQRVTLLPGKRSIIGEAQALGISSSALRQRLYRLRWSHPELPAEMVLVKGDAGKWARRACDGRFLPRVYEGPACRICGGVPVRPVEDLVEPDGRGGWRKVEGRPACFACWSREDAIREAEEHGCTWFGPPEPSTDDPPTIHRVIHKDSGRKGEEVRAVAAT